MLETVGWTSLGLSGLFIVILIIGALDDCNEFLMGAGAIGSFLFVIGFCICASIEHHYDKQRLMKQCMDSGKKEFECVSLLKEPSSTVVPFPIIIPSSR